MQVSWAFPVPCFLPFSTFSGAKHLYLLDFDPTNLPDLKSTIEKKYPDVKAGIHLLSLQY